MRDGERAPLSAIVTVFDELELLPRALASIGFCDEIIVVDIGSQRKEVAEIAAAHGAHVVEHSHVPIAEAARVSVAPQAKHDLLLVIDPDEEVPPALAAEVVELVRDLAADIAAVEAPRQYYFKGRPLRGTVWGGENRRWLIVRRSGVELMPTIWGGMRVCDGFHVVALPFTQETAIRHDWAESYGELIRRHRRYLSLEPVDRANAGEVTGYRAVARMPFASFRESFITKRGYVDGVDGLALSLFWAAFRTGGEAALLRRLRKNPRL